MSRLEPRTEAAKVLLALCEKCDWTPSLQEADRAVTLLTDRLVALAPHWKAECCDHAAPATPRDIAEEIAEKWYGDRNGHANCGLLAALIRSTLREPLDELIASEEAALAQAKQGVPDLRGITVATARLDAYNTVRRVLLDGE